MASRHQNLYPDMSQPVHFPQSNTDDTSEKVIMNAGTGCQLPYTGLQPRMFHTLCVMFLPSHWSIGTEPKGSVTSSITSIRFLHKGPLLVSSAFTPLRAHATLRAIRASWARKFHQLQVFLSIYKKQSCYFISP